MKIDPPKRSDAVLLLGLATLVLLALFPQWELAVMRWFYDPTLQWPWDAHVFIQTIYHAGTLPALTLAITGLAVAIASRWQPSLGRYRKIGLFLFFTMAIGPGVMVNSVFKEHFHRPRPRQVVEFGGEQDFRRVGQPGLGTETGRSFPSGHASMGFFLAVPYLFLRRRHRGWALTFLATGIFAGLGVGLVRVMQGAHFPGDVIASGMMVAIVARICWERMGRPSWGDPRETPTVATVTDNATNASTYVPGRVRCLDRAVYLNEREAAGRPLVSVVIPFYNEEETIDDVLQEVRACLPHAEIIAVNDGSTDGSWERICAQPEVVGLSLPVNQGQSAAILTGLQNATGEFCVLMDGDGQNDPADVEALLAAWRDGDADVICGYRAQRRDTWSRRAASRFANRVRRLFLHDGVRDTGCSLKLFHRDAVALLPPFNGLHRYLPAFFGRVGLTLEEVAVNHRSRSAGVSKYTNWKRGLVGIHDLIGVSWLLNRHVTLRPPVTAHARRPVHL